MSDELSNLIRGRLEEELDGFLEDPKQFGGFLQATDIKLNEETYAAFVFGFSMAYAQKMNFFLNEEYLDAEEMEDVIKIVKRRKPEILRAYRESLDSYD